MTADRRHDVDFDRLDADIELAWLDLQACRKAWARSPHSGTLAAEQAAEAALNKLLEFRHLVTRSRKPETLAY